MYSFEFKITKKDYYDSTINSIKSSKLFVFDIIFTLVSVLALLYFIITNNLKNLNAMQLTLLVLCSLLFFVIRPIVLYIKVMLKPNVYFNNVIKMVFNDENVVVSNNSEKVELKYENIYKILNYKNMIVIMYDSIHGQIMPNRIFESIKNNRDEFFDYVYVRINSKNKSYE